MGVYALPYYFNFNSHAHVERDALNGNYGGYPNISTHTLTWSVTELTLALEYSDSNFNSHAHVERDHYYLHVLAPLCHFNSHAHVERDIVGVYALPYYFNFNSHAHVERDPC